MTKNSMAHLSETVQQQLKADQQAVSNQTSALLKQHEIGLKKLLAASLDTTKNVIQHQIQDLEQFHRKTLSRLKWLTLWPLVASILLSLAIVTGAILWSWWKVGRANDQVQQKFNQVRQIEAQFCASPAGQSVCKKG